MSRKLALLLALLCAPVCEAHAQNAVKNWVFGRAARINFNTSTPTTSTAPPISTNEGSSSISDSNGQLLFYTDGVTVWDKNNAVMQNGTGLMGNGSSTQSALIVPCGCDEYFIFTTDGAENKYNNGLRYSLVDMTLNSGAGGVTAKNVLLLAPAAEKLAGVRAAGGGYWVVGHRIGDNRFYAYRVGVGGNCDVSPQGAATKISAVGLAYSGGSGNYGQGQMKISPDGKRLAVASLSYSGLNYLELFAFDTTTGAVSNLATTTVRDTMTEGFYGVEFSPDSQSLYATTLLGNGVLYGYNVAGNTLSSRTTIAPFGSGNYRVGALQLAPDGRIYVARQNQTFLNYLATPNLAGGGWTTTPFALAAGSMSTAGLPAMLAGDFNCSDPPTPDVCCDKMKVSPAVNPPLNQDYRTFEIFNFKQPASPICSVDIAMQPAPHTVTWQGGMASWVNSSGTVVTPNFVFDYKRLPTAGNIAAVSVPATSYAVKFNLGFDNTQAYTGKTILTVNHCDGTKCVLEYNPWVVTPPRGGGWTELNPWMFDTRVIAADLTEVTLTYEGGRVRGAAARGAKWLGVAVEGAEVYSVDAPGPGDEKGRRLALSSSAKAQGAALFEFQGLLGPESPERAGRGVTLLVRHAPGARLDAAGLRLTLYDEGANIIAMGVPGQRPGADPRR